MLFERLLFVMQAVPHCDVSLCVVAAAGGPLWNTGTDDRERILLCDAAVSGGLSSSSGC